MHPRPPALCRGPHPTVGQHPVAPGGQRSSRFLLAPLLSQPSVSRSFSCGPLSEIISPTFVILETLLGFPWWSPVPPKRMTSFRTASPLLRGGDFFNSHCRGNLSKLGNDPLSYYFFSSKGAQDPDTFLSPRAASPFFSFYVEGISSGASSLPPRNLPRQVFN